MAAEPLQDLVEIKVCFVHRSMEEATRNECHLQNSGTKYVRFKVSTVIFDVPFDNLHDAKIISRGFRHSNLMTMTDESDGVMLNRDPIIVPFEIDEFEKFLLAMAFMRYGQELEMFTPGELCTILKLADYYECRNLMRRVLSQISKKLIGKTPSEICEAFEIKSDFTAPQRRQMEEEGLWPHSTNSTSSISSESQYK